jgi:hypothetical protein
VVQLFNQFTHVTRAAASLGYAASVASSPAGS